MAAGDPTGEDLCVGTVNVSSLNDLIGDYSDTIEITFGSSVELTSGIKYAIVVRTSSTDELDWVEWGQHLSNVYPNGLRCHSFDAGNSWTQSPTRDVYFVTKASGVTKDSNSGAVSSVQNFYGDTWVGMTFTASSTYTITSVVLKLWKRGAGSTGVATISIRRVETTFTPPSSGPDITTVKRVVAAANNKIWYENI